MDGKDTDQWNGGKLDSWSNDLLAPSPWGGETGRAHRCRRRRALGSPAHAGRLPRRQESGRRGRGMRRRQDALGTARRLRGAPRLLAEDSTGSVPLQSG